MTAAEELAIRHLATLPPNQLQALIRLVQEGNQIDALCARMETVERDLATLLQKERNREAAEQRAARFNRNERRAK